MKSKVDRGKYFISDKLDLHGYSIEDAYCKLIDFIIKNYRAGNRCLLVITGYGSATNKTDTIKNNLNKWLNDTKIQHMVLYYQQATKNMVVKGLFMFY
jgi:DNA-nicking Smr family endonuclease